MYVIVFAWIGIKELWKEKQETNIHPGKKVSPAQATDVGVRRLVYLFRGLISPVGCAMLPASFSF